MKKKEFLKISKIIEEKLNNLPVKIDTAESLNSDSDFIEAHLNETIKKIKNEIDMLKMDLIDLDEDCFIDISPENKGSTGYIIAQLISAFINHPEINRIIKKCNSEYGEYIAQIITNLKILPELLSLKTPDAENKTLYPSVMSVPYSSNKSIIFSKPQLAPSTQRSEFFSGISDFSKNDLQGIDIQISSSADTPFKNVSNIDFKSNEAVMVLQHEYAETNANSDQPVLGSFSAMSCVILALYDAKNKKAVLAHIDFKTNINSLSTLFSGISLENTVAHLIGGTVESKDMCKDILNLLKSKSIKIENAILARVCAYGASLAIDSRTGAIYSPVSDSHLHSTPDAIARIKNIKNIPYNSALNLIYSNHGHQNDNTEIFKSESTTEVPEVQNIFKFRK